MPRPYDKMQKTKRITFRFFVELGGLEPPSKQAAKMLSTRLAFVEFSFVFLVKSQPKHNLVPVIRMFYRNL